MRPPARRGIAVTVQTFGILTGQRVIHILLTAQLHGHRHTARLAVLPLRKAGGQAMPGQPAGFIKRVTAALLRQQYRFNT
jgi:hypothetical protein